MKKSFLLILMVLCSLSTFAQTRKVAILETVDREGRIPYGVKLIIRSSLAKGVAETKGYEAFERTQDLGKIFDEQNFQKTGNVSDEEIRKIGEMTGVQYVLVAEASQVDPKRIYVTAKILNVETARVEMTDGVMIKNDVKSVQKGTKKLGAGLLKPYYQLDTKQVSQNSQPSEVEQPSTSKEQKDETKIPEPEPIANYLTIERISKDEYKMGDTWLTRMEYYELINNRDLCIPAYQQFQKGLKLEKTGKWTLVAGGGVLLLGTLVTAIGVPVNYQKSDEWDDNAVTIYEKYYKNNGYKWQSSYYEYQYKNCKEDYRHYLDIAEGCEISGPIFMGLGFAGSVTGGILWGVGVHKKDHAYESYNDHCAEQISFNLIFSGNGLGLAINF